MFGFWKWGKSGKGYCTVVEEVEPTTQKCGLPISAKADEAIASYLEKVFYEKAYTEYGGGTLFVSKELVNKDEELIVGGNELYFLNVNDEELDADVRYWVCMCYFKYKTKTTHFYEPALEYVQANTESNKLAKRILEFV